MMQLATGLVHDHLLCSCNMNQTVVGSGSVAGLFSVHATGLSNTRSDDNSSKGGGEGDSVPASAPHHCEHLLAGGSGADGCLTTSTMLNNQQPPHAYEPLLVEWTVGADGNDNGREEVNVGDDSPAPATHHCEHLLVEWIGC
jgi:hypothetical protein